MESIKKGKQLLTIRALPITYSAGCSGGPRKPGCRARPSILCHPDILLKQNKRKS